jgi:hypothetical protein
VDGIRLEILVGLWRLEDFVERVDVDKAHGEAVSFRIGGLSIKVRKATKGKIEAEKST